MGTGLIVWLFALILGPARAEDLPWYVGRVVESVSVEAVGSGQVQSDMAPILRTKPDALLDVGDMRSDVSLLVRAGGFSAVEAHVQPVDPADSASAVRVVYWVDIASRIKKLTLKGARGRVAKRAVLSSLGIDLGDPWFGEDDRTALISRVTSRLHAKGWTRAEVDVEPEAVSDGIRLVVRVVLNEPQVLGSVRVGGNVPVSERKIRKWLKGGGLKPGARIDRMAQEGARKKVLDELRKLGWDRARVNLFTRSTSEDNQVALTALIRPGPRLVIDASGRKLPNPRILRETLGIRAGDTISKNLREDAEARLEDWYAGRGFLNAQVEIQTNTIGPDEAEIEVHATPGPRHWVRRFVWPEDEMLSKREFVGVLVEDTPETLGDRVLTDAGIQEAERALEERYAANGYLDADVTLSVEKGSRGWVSPLFRFGVPVVVTGQVQAGPQLRLKRLEVRGGVGLEKDLVTTWREKHEQKPLNASAAAKLEKAIGDVYEANGYLDVGTTLRTVRDRTTDTAEVDIAISEGDQVFLRSIVIRGNRRTQRKVVEREILVDVGEPIDPKLIAKTRTGLYNLDLFRLVSPELIGEEVGAQDLLLRLEERPNILLEAGGGVSTDEGVRTTARATHRNIGGLGHRLTTLTTVGYGWFGDEWVLDTAEPIWRAATRYEMPYVPGRGGRLVIEGLLYEALQEPTWRMSRSGAAVGLKMRLSRKSEAVVDYRVQVRQLVDVDPGALVNGDPWIDYLGLGPDISGDPVLESGQRVVSGGSLLLVNDRRNNRFNPKRGGLWSTHLEVGDGVFSGEVTFRATAKGERLIPIGPIVLDITGRGGFGVAQGRRTTLPLEERFFLGGGTTLRGFKTDSVGPANFARRPEIDHPSQTEPIVDGLAMAGNGGQWVPTGGDMMAAASFELRVPLSLLGFRRLDQVDWVFFTDMGHVGFIDPTVVTTSRLEGKDPIIRASVGTGLRFATPVGPASLDIGFNTRPIAERDEPVVLPHLTLGVL